MKIYILTIAFLLLHNYSIGQEYKNEVILGKSEINWLQFPDFELPFTIVYDGPVPKDGKAYPLNKGFSHIAGNTKGYKEAVQKKNRVYLWTGIPGADGWARKNNQPWELAKIPWGNDILGYRKAWWNRIKYVSNSWIQSGQVEKGYDIIIADIEKTVYGRNNILELKQNELVPEEYQKLSDADFLIAYKNAMSNLYNEPLRLLKDSLGTDQIISSYGDVPILREWWGIEKYSWNIWKVDSTKLNYITNNIVDGKSSAFYHNLDFLSPTAYYFYNAEKNYLGKNYLAYLLFQIEVNKLWSDKSQLLFVWLNYHNSASSSMEPISAEMAEASAIFPLMSGVGIYNWRKKENKKGNYEYFIRGLYRMSQFTDFFDGTEEYFKPDNPVIEFKSKKVIWRAVINGDRILIAAVNPYGKKDAKIKVKYKGWEKEININKNKIFLKSFELNE